MSETFASGSLSRRERITYDYDDDGIRVSALHETDAEADGTYESRVKTQYLVDHQNFTGYQQVLEETVTDADTGELQKRIVYTIGLDQISQTTFTPGGATEGETLVFHVDGHGSTRILTNLAAAIATFAGQRQVFAFDAYGNAIGFNASAAATTLLYNNEHFDPTTGHYYLRARPYDPHNGRFPQLDPILGFFHDPQSLHKYAYVHGDPIQGIDPSGMFFGGVASFFGSFSISSAMRGMKHGAIVGALMGAVTGGIDGYTGNGRWDEALEGAVFGAISGSAVGALTGGIAGGFASGFRALSLVAKLRLLKVIFAVNVAGTVYGVSTAELAAQGIFRGSIGLLGGIANVLSMRQLVIARSELLQEFARLAVECSARPTAQLSPSARPLSFATIHWKESDCFYRSNF